ncbi:hypothetical protein B0H13DRAFT_2335116 [Mycena leptocephala]|nr:hypothetical protein B0H13DRAFT_2335116 [Mycena leptocephala]
MSDSRFDWILSRYTTSPDPASGMQSLHQTCSDLIKHVLLPSHIILVGGGFTLHTSLTVRLVEVIPSMDRILRLAAQHLGLAEAPSIGTVDLQILTDTTGLITPATQNQIVLHWVLLIDKLTDAMRALKTLRARGTLSSSRREELTSIPQLLASLPSTLRSKLPRAFLESYGIMVLPYPANSAESTRQVAARRHKELPPRSPAQPSQFRYDSVETGGLATSRTPSSSRTIDTTIAVTGTSAAVVDQPRPSPQPSMADILRQFDSYPTPEHSLRARITCIINDKSLQSSEITDHSEDIDHVGPGRFGLEAGFFRRVSNTLDEMQMLLTSASSLVPGRSTCLVDPHRELTNTLRGAHDIIQLRIAWTGLSDRMCAARDAMDQYRTEYFNIHALSSGAQGHATTAAAPDVSVMGIAVETGGLSGSLKPAKYLADTADLKRLTSESSRAHSSQCPTPAFVVELGGLDDGLASAGPSEFANGSVRTPRSDMHSLTTFSAKSNRTATDQQHTCARTKELLDDLGGLRKTLCASAKLKAPQHCAESLTIDLEDARHQVPAPPDSLATVQRGGLGSRTTFRTVARIPGTRSKSHPRAHELQVVHDIPVPKSPAPALTIANAVELRGLCRQMVEPCTTVNLENVPHVSTTAELGEQVEDKRGLRDTVDQEGKHARMDKPRTSENLAVKDGGLEESIGSQDQLSDARTSEPHKQSKEAALPSSSAFSPAYCTPLDSAPPAHTIVMDYKSFMLISTILRTLWIPHLGYSLVGELVACLAWDREGIGTSIRI